jgi:hypothetical protein
MAVDLTFSSDEDHPPLAAADGRAASDPDLRQTTLTSQHQLLGVSKARRVGDDVATVRTELRGVRDRLARVRRELVQKRNEEADLCARERQLEDAVQDAEEQALSARNSSGHDWERGNFPWDEKVDHVLRQVFKLQAFRPLRDGQTQRSIVNATLQKLDVLVLMATGSGKSLCYQLPALCEEPGVTLVVRVFPAARASPWQRLNPPRAV